MRKPQSPCYECEDRERLAAEHEGNCHGEWCAGWKKYMQDKHAYNRMLHRQKTSSVEAIQYVKTAAIKQRKRKHDR